MRQRLRASKLIVLLGLVSTLGCSKETTTVNASDIYQSACASCHGSRGTGGLPASEGSPAPRNFADAVWQASRSDDDLIRVVTGGKGQMPSFGDVLSQGEIEALVAQVRSFGPAASTPATGGGR